MSVHRVLRHTGAQSHSFHQIHCLLLKSSIWLPLQSTSFVSADGVAPAYINREQGIMLRTSVTSMFHFAVSVHLADRCLRPVSFDLQLRVPCTPLLL